MRMVKFAMIVLGILVLCSGLASINLDLEEGESCVESNSGTSGICTPMAKCPAAVNNLKRYRQSPTVCSFEREMPVVCCERTTLQTTAAPVREPVPMRTQQTNARKRISELKCEEYSKPVTKTVSHLSLLLDEVPVGLTVPNCTYDKDKLLVGGDAALPGQFPHMAAIGWPSVDGGLDFKCGGTLISERFVLTAGHCTSASSHEMDLTSLVPTIIRLGDHDLRPDEYDGAQPVDMLIGRIFKHPEYKPPIFYNDIALLEMEQPVVLNSFVRPACLWQSNDFGRLDSGIVTGWGATTYRGPRSDVLLKVSLKLFSNEFCQPLLDNLKSRKWKDGFSNEQMCAGNLEGGHDLCQGSGGGPLNVNLKDNHCIFFVMGIISFGRGCGEVNIPGVYTRVSSFVPWIESIVWRNGAEIEEKYRNFTNK